MVANMSDDDIWRLNRGGHDPHKVYAAYAQAAAHRGQPTVILAKTVKGYGMGDAGEGQNVTHQQKKMGEEALRAFRDRFRIPLTDDQIADAPFYRPPPDSPEIRYLKERRRALGGFLPARADRAAPLETPGIDLFASQLEGSRGREISTTMAFVRLLTALLRDKTLGPRVVPIVPDEARTFGMEGLFRQLGIYSSKGQLYEPQDADQLMYYREDVEGQILEEGISEAGAFSSWTAAATSYANHGLTMIPFYIFYSMFGFQRIGDLAWAAGDLQARGFLLGATAGRTTLGGEGLQHCDGHSHVLASNIPNCVAYDPTFACELAVILHAGLRRMVEAKENVFYYLTVMNETYAHPALPEGSEEGILKGLYRLPAPSPGGGRKRAGRARVRLLGSGAILREAIAAADLLDEDYGVESELFGATSFTELRRDGLEVARWNLLHPDEAPRTSHVERCLGGDDAPVVAATDYVKLYADQIREFVPARYVVLGTDGFGRSDVRAALRRYFEVDRHFIAIAALKALADEGRLPAGTVLDAIRRYGVDPDRAPPAAR